MLLLIILILLLSSGFGAYGHRAGWGYYGWSPMGLVLIILIVLLLTGHL